MIPWYRLVRNPEWNSSATTQLFLLDWTKFFNICFWKIFLWLLIPIKVLKNTCLSQIEFVNLSCWAILCFKLCVVYIMRQQKTWYEFFYFFDHLSFCNVFQHFALCTRTFDIHGLLLVCSRAFSRVFSRISLSRHCTKNHIFFLGTSWKDGLSKKMRWNMVFLVLLGKMIFLFPENMILHVGRKMKDDLS